MTLARWVEKEITILQTNYSTMKQAKLCSLLNRSWSAISSKAHLLKLKRPVRLRQFYKKFSAFELGFISAAIECDGCISLGISKERRANRPDGRFYLDSRIEFSNMKESLANYFYEVTEKVGTFRHDGVCYKVQIKRALDIIAILEQIIPYLITKKEQGELLVEYCKSRLNHQRAPYTIRELHIWRKMGELNAKRGKTRFTHALCKFSSFVCF